MGGRASDAGGRFRRPSLAGHHAEQIRKAYIARTVGEQALQVFRESRNGFEPAAIRPALDLKSSALDYLADGVSLVPCSAKTKQPDNNLLPTGEDGRPTWKPYQTEPASAATVESWFARGCQSVAAIGGTVSGGLLIIDFDEARFYDSWQEQVGSLAEGLPVQRTGREGGGFQVWLRCPEPGRNEKLAWVPDEAEDSGRKVAIEIKGEGGYCVAPGSLHPSGRRYQAIAGDFANIPTVPQAVADALIAAARKLDEAPLTRKERERKRREKRRLRRATSIGRKATGRGASSTPTTDK